MLRVDVTYLEESASCDFIDVGQILAVCKLFMAHYQIIPGLHFRKKKY